ncbi:MAG: rhodanese-like domain-containing protein [Oscillospiraceae bacterium]|nr:rhodanese-like domain-containing protein [Oscillospiraceae bacterium]
MTDHTRFLIRILALSILVLALLLSCGCSKKEEESPAEPAPVEEVQEAPEVQAPVTEDGYTGYRDAEAVGEGFVAVGTGGRIDLIDINGEVKSVESGTREDLRCVYAETPNVVVSGTNGTLLVSYDGAASFSALDVGTKNDLNGATAFEDVLYAAGEDGVIYRNAAGGWEAMQMETTHDFIGIVSTNYCLAAITEETDICISTDGEEWEYMNFNEEYDGLYPRYVFTRAVGAGETFFILGYEEENPNIPVLFFTETGEVYMEKGMTKINGEYASEEMDLHIHDISFNIDQIVGVMNDGRVLAITDCMECNEEKVLDEAKDLWATAAQEKGVLLCGEDFYSLVMDSKQIRQDKIKAEQAYADTQYGALIIDVREQEELDESGYVAGSIHIPLAEVEEKLPEIAPDHNTELIFYCASGKRSQKATELAVEMGYQSVYNLGGLSDIEGSPFEIVKD